MLRFNPPPNTARYAFHSDGGPFKIYNELSSAKNAWHSSYSAKKVVSRILENVEGAWYVLYAIPADTSRDKLPWYKEATSWRNSGKRFAYPMTRDEYAEWRLEVERERLGFKKIDHQ